MANPIQFEPKKIDPRRELERRLQAAPAQHAEALLVLFEVLEEAHDQGLLDLLHGMLGSKNEVAGKFAYYAKQPISVQAMRNLIILAEVLGSLDPAILAGARNRVLESREEPPSLWRLFRNMASRDGRRGLAMILAFITAIGKSIKTADR